MKRLLFIIFALSFIAISALGMVRQCHAEEKTTPYYVTTWPDKHQWLKDHGWLSVYHKEQKETDHKRRVARSMFMLYVLRLIDEGNDY